VDAQRDIQSYSEATSPAPWNSGEVYQCVPNFSEGRDLAVVEEIAAAVRAAPGALLIDASADPDHNRCVLTILGQGAAVSAAVVAAARVAVARIDLRAHSGVHPRTGAIDVAPVVPLRGAGRAEAVSVVEEIGRALSDELGIPVYFYEWNARPGRRSGLPEIRQGGFEALRGAELTGDRAPDRGPGRAHPTAGVAVVGARGPLVAYNVNFRAPDAAIARAIARRIRAERDKAPALAGVRALGLYLESQQRAQVSMNLTRPELTPLPALFRTIAAHAGRLQAEDLESEIIGAIPAASLGGEPPEAIQWHTYRPEQLLETWLSPGGA
jgi:glutamate formiminotransferase